MKPHYRLRVRAEGRALYWALEQPDPVFPKRSAWYLTARGACRHVRYWH